MPGALTKRRTRRAGLKTRAAEAKKKFKIQVITARPRHVCKSHRGVNFNNLIDVKLSKPTPTHEKLNFVPTILLANTMSLVPKLEEVQNCLSANNVDIGCITETWLKNTVSNSVVEIPNHRWPKQTDRQTKNIWAFYEKYMGTFRTPFFRFKFNKIQ